MPSVLMYTTRVCPFCQMAKRLLASKGVVPVEVRIDEDLAQRDEMMTRTGRRTVPQIYVGDTHVGGFEDLAAWDRDGRLDALLTP